MMWLNKYRSIQVHYRIGSLENKKNAAAENQNVHYRIGSLENMSIKV